MSYKKKRKYDSSKARSEAKQRRSVMKRELSLDEKYNKRSFPYSAPIMMRQNVRILHGHPNEAFSEKGFARREDYGGRQA